MLRIRQTETGWEVLADGALVASFKAESQLGEMDGWRRSYADALSFVGVEMRASLKADGEAEGSAGLLAERWVTPPGSGIIFARPTGDGRDLTGCTFTWRDPAVSLVPLMYLNETEWGHFGAELVGFHEEFAVVGDAVTSAGRFYDSELAEEARNLLLDGRFFGVSADGGQCEVVYECLETDDDGWCIEDKLSFLSYEIIGSTMCPFPAHAEAKISLEVLEIEPVEEGEPVPIVTVGLTRPRLVAAATDAPARPPRSWFEMEEPGDDDPRYVDQGKGRVAIPMQITDDGQVYGHMAPDDVPHVGYPGRNITVPYSPTNCAHFNLASIPCDDGSRVSTGVVMVGCDHAPLTYSAQEARDFYAHSGLGWADVHASNGVHGIWTAGAVRPGLTSNQLRMIHGSSLSGHWCPIGGALELCGCLSVNQPGFPVIRESIAAAAGEDLRYVPFNARQPQALVRDGEIVAVVAAGIVRDCPECLKRRREMGVTVGMDALTAAVLTEMANIARGLAVLERRTRHLIPAEREAVVAAIRSA